MVQHDYKIELQCTYPSLKIQTCIYQTFCHQCTLYCTQTHPFKCFKFHCTIHIVNVQQYEKQESWSKSKLSNTARRRDSLIHTAVAMCILYRLTQHLKRKAYHMLHLVIIRNWSLFDFIWKKTCQMLHFILTNTTAKFIPMFPQSVVQ